MSNKPHTDWCGDQCAAETEGAHTSRATIASEGGPLREADTNREVDIAPSVALRGFDDGTAEVVLTIDTWLRRGQSWGIPGELFDLLPDVPMTATRARYLAKLLTEAADEADRLNDATGTNVTIIDFGGGE